MTGESSIKPVHLCSLARAFLNWLAYLKYHKVPRFSDARIVCCNLPKIQTNRSNLGAFHQKYANGKANSEDPDQTAPLVAV